MGILAQKRGCEKVNQNDTCAVLEVEGANAQKPRRARKSAAEVLWEGLGVFGKMRLQADRPDLGY